MEKILCVFILIASVLVLSPACSNANPQDNNQNLEVQENQDILPGVFQTNLYFPLLEGKKIGLTVNQSSIFHETHLVDSLLSHGLDLKKVFSPEHGFRGNADAGAHIEDEIDKETGLQLVSVYGNKKKPSVEDLADIDIMIFDIQDVGVRFYTYTSTMHYMMEACAENNIPVIILDRPNPNGYYVDGPMLDLSTKSFIGMHEVPVVYGMSIGEYAQMLKGENWFNKAENLDLTIIPCKHYDHSMTYALPIKPSPNLPNHRSILLYPSLCFFEGTHVSIGRGTDKQFQLAGHPDLKEYSFSFIPEPKPGATNPKQNGVECFGYDYSHLNIAEIFDKRKLDLGPFLEMYAKLGEPMFLNNNFFDKLAGSPLLKEQILAGLTEEEIRETWKEGLADFMKMRAKYLLYEDFD